MRKRRSVQGTECAFFNLLVLTIILFISFCQWAFGTNLENIPSIGKNDLFRADVELLEINKLADLSIFITSLEKEEKSPYSYSIEAIAIINVDDHCSFYGLKGQYDEYWKHLILDLPAEINGHAVRGNKKIPDLPSISLAGRLSEDKSSLYCSISFNGGATLKKISGTDDRRYDLLQRISHCQ